MNGFLAMNYHHQNISLEFKFDFEANCTVHISANLK